MKPPPRNFQQKRQQRCWMEADPRFEVLAEYVNVAAEKWGTA